MLLSSKQLKTIGYPINILADIAGDADSVDTIKDIVNIELLEESIEIICNNNLKFANIVKYRYKEFMPLTEVATKSSTTYTKIHQDLAKFFRKLSSIKYKYNIEEIKKENERINNIKNKSIPLEYFTIAIDQLIDDYFMNPCKKPRLCKFIKEKINVNTLGDLIVFVEIHGYDKIYYMMKNVSRTTIEELKTFLDPYIKK